MASNNFLNTATQKAFIDRVPGCSERHLKLLTILREAQRRRKCLCVCWLDLANVFGSAHHDLIAFSLAHYHAPPEIIWLVSNLYDGLTAVISTSKWTTAPIHLQLGVYQGDLLSVIFNTMMNTLLDSITQCCVHLGYSLNSVPGKVNLQHQPSTSPSAVERKVQRYEALSKACSRTHHTTIITLEVGSRGFLCMEGFQQLYRLLRAKVRDRQSFEIDLVRHAVTCLYNIWCKCKWC